MDGTTNGEGFSGEQRSGLEARRADHDRTLDSMHVLEAALSEAAPGREASWGDSVLDALAALEAATAEEAENAQRPDSLLFDLAHRQPRLRNRARALRLQYAKVRETVASLRKELEANQDAGVDYAGVDYADVRQRLGWVLTALRHQRARESDLIYEAYFDAFKAELRMPGGKGTP